MSILLTLAATFTTAYLLLLRHYHKSWRNLPGSIFSQRHEEHRVNSQSSAFLSVVIAARNEEHRVAECLTSVTRQNYPEHLYEVIMVDDGSEDATSDIVLGFTSVRLLRTGKKISGKKQALTLGIRECRGEIIVTTDADCIVQENWLHSVAESFESNTMMVTGPVLIRDGSSAFARFQMLELAGLATVTAAGIRSGLHHLANGANMAFRKSAFEAVRGFDQKDRYASGDDVFLVQAIAGKFPGGVRYNQSPKGIVYTQAMTALGQFIRQRIRWATKNKSLPEKSVFILWAFIWITFVLNASALVAAALYSLPALLFSCGLLLAIAIGEYLFLRSPVTHFAIQNAFKHYWLSFLIHYIYVIAIGFASVFRRKYSWKGRVVR